MKSTGTLSLILIVMGALLICTIPTAIMQSFSQEEKVTRGIMNKVDEFVQQVADTGVITDVDKANLMMDVNSLGVDVDVKISKMLKVISPDGNGGTYISYTPGKVTTRFNKGDKVAVVTQVLDYTSWQTWVWKIRGVISAPFKYTQSGTVR